MRGNSDSKAPRRRIDAAAKAEFLAALRRGARREDAARVAGFSLMAFYGARSRDPGFRAEWTQALAATPAAERRARAYAERGEVRIAPANRRLLQRRRRRQVRFTAERQALFLAFLAMTCDTRASAGAAGVSVSTVTLHRRTDPAFAALYREALAEGYVALEAEAVRQRLAAQKRLRAAREAADGAAPPDRACPHCGRTAEAAAEAEFDRTLKLLARFDRKPRRVERGFHPEGRRQRWSFERAILELDRHLRGIGARTSGPPPDVPEE